MHQVPVLHHDPVSDVVGIGAAFGAMVIQPVHTRIFSIAVILTVIVGTRQRGLVRGRPFGVFARREAVIRLIGYDDSGCKCRGKHGAEQGKCHCGRGKIFHVYGMWKGRNKT